MHHIFTHFSATQLEDSRIVDMELDIRVIHVPFGEEEKNYFRFALPLT